jgi:outer membrane receptor protein involved in Fe transport
VSRTVFWTILCAATLSWSSALGQEWGHAEGIVTDADSGFAIPNVTVLIEGTNFGTASNEDGFFALRIPVGRWSLRFSIIGYATQHDSVIIEADRRTRLDKVLRSATTESEEIVVEGEAPDAGAIEIDPKTIQDVPAPFRDGFRILKIMPGVATNNELSSDYSVRGGGYNENLVYIDGFEVFKPFRVRQGEQEGLGLVNPDLTQRITFYNGGFPARFGGKLSSALDVRYGSTSDAALSGSLHGSLLDAGLTLKGRVSERVGASLGVRRASGTHLFETQEVEGEYDPDYTDVQGRVDVGLGGGHSVQLTGLWAKHRFRLEPNTQKTYFGTFDNLQSIWFNYSGEERDGYETGFAGTRLVTPWSRSVRMENGISFFGTEETEAFDISGDAVLFIIDDPFEADPDEGEGLIPVGAARQEDFADNRVQVRNFTFDQRWLLNVDGRSIDAGWYLRAVEFEDEIDEKSVVVGRNTTGDVVRLVADSLFDDAAFDGTKAGAFVEHSFGLGESDALTATVGLRADYFSFNDEMTWSPRLSLVYKPRRHLTLSGSAGIYHQAPGYKEFRGTPSSDLEDSVNRELKSQRSTQAILGAEWFFPGRRLFFRAEAYYKDLYNLISYDVNNVRLTYSGYNDTDGYTYGFDLQVRGEFVPGLESWLNYGFLVSREIFRDEFVTKYNEGSIPRPSDQRHTVSLFLQDYVPSNDSWKLHMRLLYGSGLPYTPPVPGPTVGNVQAQVPGPRNSARYPAYQRVDMGVTKLIELSPKSIGPTPVNLELTAELLNVFNMTNTVAYTWVANASGVWSRIPTRLTPRTFNIRLRLTF